VATLRPFRALRPRPETAAPIAAVPYDVVNTDEARALADGNPLSFLRVSRSEIELNGSDPYAPAVYARAAENFSNLRRTSLVLEDDASLYLYRLRLGDHEQTGIAGCFAIEEYNRDVIKKHERTRPDKEDDRTRHMIALEAQTGPVFLVYRADRAIDDLVARASTSEPLFDFAAPDGVRHTIWRASPIETERFVAAFGRVRNLYIADGHHRAASAARTWADRARSSVSGASLGDGADASTLLAVAFPHDQVLVLPYNRIVRDLGGLSRDGFMRTVREAFVISPGPATPRQRGEIAMYIDREWHLLVPRHPVDRAHAVRSLDVSVLQDQLLTPILKIADVRTDKRIDFVGGARGTTELERLVDTGQAAVAFSLHPISVDDLMTVSDAGEIMPPKSSWFEPKLRDGLLVHVI
jgi:uncharacterized protein (DUF1015 family)